MKKIILIICFMFYIWNIDVGLNYNEPADNNEISKMVEAHNKTIQRYKDNESYSLDRDTIYWNNKRVAYTQARISDSHKVLGALNNIKQNKGNQIVSRHYGGAYLYPLGAWMYIIDKCGIINAHSSLEFYLRNPSEIHGIHKVARFFNVLATTICVWLVGTITGSWIAMSIFGLNPMVVGYAHDIKPFMYGCMMMLFALKSKKWWSASLFTGLALSSCLHYGFFIVYVCAKHKRLLVPILIMLCVYMITNPYTFIEYNDFIKSTLKKGLIGHYGVN